MDPVGTLLVSHTTFVEVRVSEGVCGSVPGYSHLGPSTRRPHSDAVAGRHTFQLELDK
jgi:hypothetical protein